MPFSIPLHVRTARIRKRERNVASRSLGERSDHRRRWQPKITPRATLTNNPASVGRSHHDELVCDARHSFCGRRLRVVFVLESGIVSTRVLRQRSADQCTLDASARASSRMTTGARAKGVQRARLRPRVPAKFTKWAGQDENISSRALHNYLIYKTSPGGTEDSAAPS